MVGQHLRDILAAAPQRIIKVDRVDVVLEATRRVLLIAEAEYEGVRVDATSQAVDTGPAVEQVVASRSYRKPTAV